MKKPSGGLLAAFQADHRALGQMFHALSGSLRAGDLPEARRLAYALDMEAGPHIAFEEARFYPRLVALIGDAEVRRMYAEHAEALALIETLTELPPDAGLSPGQRRGLLARSEAMETHIAECGELFAAMGRIPEDEQKALCGALFEWRARAPTWRAYAADARAASDSRGS